jgi:hypothetical protein
LWQKRNEPAAALETAVDQPGHGRAAPMLRRPFRIGSRNAPQIIANRETSPQSETETTMDIGRNDRVLKIIGMLMTFAPEIKAGLQGANDITHLGLSESYQFLRM